MEILPPKQGDWARSPVCGSPVSVLDPDCPAVYQAPFKVFGKPCISYMVGSDAWLLQNFFLSGGKARRQD